MMKIYLKKDWAKFIDYEAEDDIFVGREKELQNLTAYVINNNTGSILLSGIRGVGKTSFVYKLIQKLNNHYISCSNPKFVPILINVSQLNLKDGNLYENIIQSLIRRLYAKLMDKKTSPELENLYKKVQGEYYKSEETFESEEMVKEKRKKDSFSFSLKKEIARLSFLNLLKLASVIVGISLIILPNTVLFKILGGFLLVIPTMSLSYVYDKVIELVATNINRKSAKEYYKKDNSIGNLEHDLREFLKNNRQKYKFLFVIDELDKLDGKDGTNPLKIIELYKNLFTLSNANYLFITDQKIYEQLLRSTKKEHTTTTLFTHKLFLMEPNYNDLIEYFDKIVIGVKLNGKNISKLRNKEKIERENYDLVVNYLIYESRTDFFDLKNKINGCVNHDSNSNPYLDIDLIFDENNKEDIRLKVVLLKIIMYIYEVHRYKTLGNFHINQKMLDLMFDLISSHIGDKLQYNTTTKKLIFPEAQGDKKNEALSDTNENHLINFLDLATRHKILKRTGDETIGTYEWTTEIPDINISFTDLLRDEKVFIDKFNLLISVVNDIDDLSKSDDFKAYNQIYSEYDGKDIIGKPTHPTYKKFLPYYNKLILRIPSHIPIENLKTYTTELNSFITGIFTDVIDITSRALIKNLSEVEKNTVYTIVKSNESTVLTSLQDFKAALNGVPHKIIHSDDLSKQIIIAKNYDLNSLNSKALKALDEQSKSVYFLNIITENEKTPRKAIEYQRDILVGKDKQGNDRIKKEKRRLQKNFSEVKFTNSYRVFREIFNDIKTWLK